jgi:glycogen(starch) synthase
LRIVFLTREYPPESMWGGPATTYHNLATVFANLGHEVHVICQAVGSQKDSLQEGVFVHRVGTNPKRYSVLARINYNLNAFKKLRELYKNYDIDVIETVYWSAEAFPYVLLSNGRKHNTVLIIRSTSLPSDAIDTHNFSGIEQLLGLKILSKLTSFTAKRADCVIAESEISYHNMTKRSGVDPHKVRLIHQTVNVEEWTNVNSNMKDELGIGRDKSIVLYVGRLQARKGFHVLCKAIPIVVKAKPNVKFVVVGKDTYTAHGQTSFKEWAIDEAKIRSSLTEVVFIDYLPRKKLVRLFSACDVFVLPSIEESFGVAVLEAMMSGKPIVATRVGIVPELERHQPSGLAVIPAGDPEKLAKAIIKLVSHKDDEKRRIAGNHRDIVESYFSTNVWIDETIKLYRSTVEQRTSFLDAKI